MVNLIDMIGLTLIASATGIAMSVMTGTTTIGTTTMPIRAGTG